MTTIIIGAGLTGLTAAWRLSERDQSFRVLEASPRAGGRIETEVRDGYRLEWGPNSIVSTRQTLFDLVEELDLASELRRADRVARKRYIVRGGELCPLPTSPMSFITSPALSWRAKLRLLGEPLVRSRRARHESAAEFFRRRFGNEVVDYLLDPFVSGIYAGKAERLEMASAFPRVAEFEDRQGSVIRGLLSRAFASTPRAKYRGTYWLHGGLQRLVDALVTRLGPRIEFGQTVTSVRSRGSGFIVECANGAKVVADRVWLCCPAFVAARLLRSLVPDIATDLAGIPYAGIGVVQVGLDPSQLPRPLDAFGFLVPWIEAFDILGAIWSSAVFPERASPGKALLTVFLGGARALHVAQWSARERERVAIDALGRVFGAPLSVEMVASRWIDRAIPQLVVGHRARVARIDAACRHLPGLGIAGNFLAGVSMHDAVAAGNRVSVAAASDHAT